MPPEKPSEKSKQRQPRPLKRGILPAAYDLALRWAITLTVAVLAGVFAGRWVDQKLGTTPLFILIGLFWGVGGSFFSIYLQLKKMQEKEEKESHRSEPTGRKF